MSLVFDIGLVVAWARKCCPRQAAEEVWKRRLCLALAWGWLGRKNAAIGRQKRKCGKGIALVATGTPCGTRTRNLRIRSPTPCPLGQGGLCLPESHVATRFWLVLALQAAQATLACDEGLSCGAGGAPSRLLAAISSASEVIRADNNDPPRTRTWNLRLRRLTPYPLGQRTFGNEAKLRIFLERLLSKTKNYATERDLFFR